MNNNSFPSEDLNGQAGLVDPPAPKPARRVAPGRGKWILKDGSIVAIRDIEDSHIRNCILMMRRHSRVWLYNLGMSAGAFAAATGGDGAADAANDASDECFDIAEDPHALHEYCLDEYPKYRELVREAKRRGLEIEAL